MLVCAFVVRYLKLCAHDSGYTRICIARPMHRVCNCHTILTSPLHLRSSSVRHHSARVDLYSMENAMDG